MQQIVPGVYTFTGLLMGRVYLLQDEDALTLVDAGLKGIGGRILRQISDAGHSPAAVRRILMTHAHPDHIGSLQVVQQATGAEVWCHPLEKPVIEGDIPIPGPSSGLRFPPQKVDPAPVSRTFVEGETLPILGGLQVIETPGHAPGHVSFWHPERRLMIVGDVIFYFFNRMTLPLAMATVDMDENRRSVQKLAPFQPDTMLFGHGQPIVGGAAAHLAAFMRRLGL